MLWCIAEQGRVRAWGAVVRGEVVCCGVRGESRLWCEGMSCDVVYYGEGGGVMSQGDLPGCV